MQNVNSVVITGNLTRDPDLRHTQAGTAVANLRVAVNTRQKTSGGEWADKPNYFNVTVWGNQGVVCSEHLEKGRGVAISGRLDWNEKGEGEARREYVQIVADTVQFLPKGQAQQDGAEPVPPQPLGTPDAVEVAEPAVLGGGEEEIPF
jgi:single-strand DNA-binding protein